MSRPANKESKVPKTKKECKVLLPNIYTVIITNLLIEQMVAKIINAFVILAECAEAYTCSITFYLVPNKPLISFLSLAILIIVRFVFKTHFQHLFIPRK